MPLSSNARKKLKALAHHLNPTVMLGNKGLTQNVCLETSRALTIHELIKVRVSVNSREERQQIIHEICNFCEADLVGMVGHIAILYRENPELKKFLTHTSK